MQPATGLQWTAIGTGAGTTVVKNEQAIFGKIIISGTYVGSATWYDTATAAGTSTTNQILTLGLPTTSVPQSLELNIQCKNGLVCMSGGTPAITYTWL